MQVEVNEQVLIPALLYQGLFGCVNSRLKLDIWVQVEPIEVVVKSVQTEIASGNPIGV